MSTALPVSPPPSSSAAVTYPCARCSHTITVETGPLVGEEAERELASFCKALAHPTRIRILKMLLNRQCCVFGHLVDALPVAQSTVSEHLKILKQAGLVQGELDGPRICYCIRPAGLARLKVLMESL